MDISGEIAKILHVALDEDAGRGDVTSEAAITAESTGQFVMRARGEMVFCGAEAVTQGFSPYVKLLAADGARLQAGDVIAEINGNLRYILLQERSVLNLLHFLSAIATETARYVAAVEGTNAKILDTRKTVPGLRMLSKYAVKCGGGQNHRMGLHDMIMVKDNHIAAAGGIESAIAKARKYLNMHLADIKIEVECDNLEQVREAVEAGADIILADNMNQAQLREVVAVVAGKALVEASGNVDLQNVRAIAETGINYISTSKITMAARPVDIGLDLI